MKPLIISVFLSIPTVALSQDLKPPTGGNVFVEEEIGDEFPAPPEKFDPDRVYILAEERPEFPGGVSKYVEYSGTGMKTSPARSWPPSKKTPSLPKSSACTGKKT